MGNSNSLEKIRILLVDDEKPFLTMARDNLEMRGCEVMTAADAGQAVSILESNFFDVVVLDIRMPGMDGLSLLKRLTRERPTLQVMMLSGHATVQTAVDAMKYGAFDFLLKPLDVENFYRVIRRAADKARLERQNIAMGGELARAKKLGPIIGESKRMQEVFDFIHKAASTDIPVLITGESGTGKELVAHAIHARSMRSTYPFVIVDGSSLREELIASELFGHEKGAFTGAVQKKAGLFEVADRGSIFLDEIGELSQPNQAALLRVIEYGIFRPVGAVREIHTDVRIIAATNKDISKASATGEFRTDLYFRLKGLAIQLPPLRERPADVPLLTDFFLASVNNKTGKNIRLSDEAIKRLMTYEWPGNVRELRYVVEMAALSAHDNGEIEIAHLPQGIKPAAESALGDRAGAFNNGFGGEELNLEDFRNRYERIYVEKLLEKYKGNKSEVSRILGLSSSVFYRMLRRLNLF
ncbi:sigma-54-dependent Fis family transcriptional regulator [bacterium]|nr:sigma-54-dependent Fis family transcriptional regulator [bacterium]